MLPEQKINIHCLSGVPRFCDREKRNRWEALRAKADDNGRHLCCRACRKNLFLMDEPDLWVVMLSHMNQQIR